MPKTKTHRGAAKRFKVTGGGKIVRRKVGKGHILTKKRPDRKRRLGRLQEVSGTDKKRVKKLLGK